MCGGACGAACAAPCETLYGRSVGRRRTDAVALGVRGHRTRVGIDSYQHPSVAYRSAGKPKVPKMAPRKGPAQTFQDLT